MGKFIGIDLGTTFSCMAYINEDGNPEIIQNAEGQAITPSTVLFEDGVVIVGEAAKEQSLLEPENVGQFMKRYMGDREYKLTLKNGESYTPEALSSLVLKKLKRDAEDALGDTVEGAVVTVPAYFNDAQREATIHACQIAGLNVLAIINEPTAAALAFGIAKGSKSETIMVYDLGGGTFDVTVMRFDGENINVLGSDGNRKLGGYDFDKMIIDAAVSAAKQEGLNPESDPSVMQEFQLKAEAAKKTLSTALKATIALKIDGKPFKYVITRDEFNEMLEPFFYNTVGTMDNACDEAGITYKDLDKVLLVGGSTRIPYVKEFIKSETGLEPSSEVHPDEAVAIGAAYHALEAGKQWLRKMEDERRSNQAQGTGDQGSAADKPVDVDIPETKRKYKFTDVTSHGIGVVVLNPAGEKENSIILPKNEKVPAQYKNRYTTSVPYQERLLIQVTQGEEKDLRFVSIIGTAEIPISPREKLVPIICTISCDENSIIHVRVYDEDAGKDLGEIHIDRVSNLTEEEIRADEIRISKLDIG